MSLLPSRKFRSQKVNNTIATMPTHHHHHYHHHHQYTEPLTSFMDLLMQGHERITVVQDDAKLCLTKEQCMLFRNAHPITTSRRWESTDSNRPAHSTRRKKQSSPPLAPHRKRLPTIDINSDEPNTPVQPSLRQCVAVRQGCEATTPNTSRDHVTSRWDHMTPTCSTLPLMPQKKDSPESMESSCGSSSSSLHNMITFADLPPCLTQQGPYDMAQCDILGEEALNDLLTLDHSPSFDEPITSTVEVKFGNTKNTATKGGSQEASSPTGSFEVSTPKRRSSGCSFASMRSPPKFKSECARVA